MIGLITLVDILPPGRESNAEASFRNYCRNEVKVILSDSFEPEECALHVFIYVRSTLWRHSTFPLYLKI